MYSVLLTIHLMVTVFLIVIILAQRSASDGMGLSGSSSTSFLSGRAAASAVTRATAILAALFILTSLGMGILTARSHGVELSMADRIATKKTITGAPATPAPTAATPGTPSAPAAVAPAQGAPTPPKPSVPHPE